jgi:regulatory protein
MAFGQLSLKGRALRLLSQREHSRSELVRKLCRHVSVEDLSAAREQVEQAIGELAEHGFVSDERTADSVFRTQSQRFGVTKIRQTLQAKGLDPDLIAATLAKAKTTELECARQVWQRKFGQPASQAKERARQQRFLAGRGFSAETIRRVISDESDLG